MRTFRNLIIAGLLTSGLLTNCKKSDITSKTGNGATTESLVTPSCTLCSITVKTNPSNPYDTAGLRHNSGCNYIAELTNTDSTYTAAQTLAFTKQFMETEHYDTAAFQRDYNYMVANNYYAIPDSFYEVHTDSLINRLYRNSLISLAEKNYFNSMWSVVNTYIGNDSPSQRIYDTAANHFIAIESTIIADNTLTTAQKQELLSTASIYRYSAAFWGTYILTNGASILVREPGIKPPLFGIHLRWKGFLAADGGGAIAGGIAAWVTGAGIVVGAIGGGVGASIGHLFFNT